MVKHSILFNYHPRPNTNTIAWPSVDCCGSALIFGLSLGGQKRPTKIEKSTSSANSSGTEGRRQPLWLNRAPSLTITLGLIRFHIISFILGPMHGG
jgi:hypothetical protein